MVQLAKAVGELEAIATNAQIQAGKTKVEKEGQKRNAGQNNSLNSVRNSDGKKDEVEKPIGSWNIASQNKVITTPGAVGNWNIPEVKGG